MRVWIIAFALLPILGTAYVMWRVGQLLPMGTLAKTIVLVMMAVATALFFVALAAPIDKLPFASAAVIYEVGTSWIFILLYLVMTLLVVDVTRVLHVVPKEWFTKSAVGSVALLFWMVAIFGWANHHYRNKVRQPLTLKTEKSEIEELKIVMMSDLHLGYTNRKAEFNRWIDLVNAEHPDLILIGGDIIDGSIRAIRHQQMVDDFKRLCAPVYACLGNHEYYAGVADAEQFYREAGICLLKDEVAVVKGIQIIGRDDRTNPRRKSLEALMSKADKALFTILLDHQPYHLEQAEAADIDFQLSGHTHYGQVWPINWIEDAIYEDAFGPLQKGRTQYYVTSGIGIWGGKFRMGTRSEYLVVTVKP